MTLSKHSIMTLSKHSIMTLPKYNLDPLDSTTIIVAPESNIDDIFVINPTINNFRFIDGNYYLSNALIIDRPGIKFIGGSKDCTKVHIFQTNTLKDGLIIKIKSVEIRHISVHVPHDYKIALTVLGNDTNLTKVEYCHFYGNGKSYTILYQGPEVEIGGDTIDAYNTNNLNHGNVFRKNVVYSNWCGDNIKYSLQKNGLFTGNIIRGGKISINMCRSCYITSNLIYDSNTNGIQVSLPCHSLQIKYNKVYECVYSAIKIANQLEHGRFLPTKYNILIRENYVYDSKHHAIEVDDVDGLQIINNQFIHTDTYAVMLLNSKDVIIQDNKISYFKSGIWSERSNYVRVLNNKFYSVYPDIADNVVRLVEANNHHIIANKIMGRVKEIPFDISADSINTDVNENIFKLWYSYPEDIKVLNDIQHHK